KGEPESGADKCPHERLWHIEEANAREQEYRTGYQQQRAGKGAVKRSVPSPVRDTAYTRREENCACRGRPERMPVQADEAEQTPCDHGDRKPVAHRGGWTAAPLLRQGGAILPRLKVRGAVPTQ